MKRSIWFLSCVFLFGCSDQDQSKAKRLTKGELTNILADIHLVEVSIQDRSYGGDTASYVYHAAMRSIYERHGTDSATFHTQFKEWMQDVKALDDLYAAVVDTLSYREALSRSQTEHSKEPAP